MPRSDGVKGVVSGFADTLHRCGGHRCWDNRRHHGHSGYYKDAGNHVSFRIFQKKFL
jgi:hypothetical protein